MAETFSGEETWWNRITGPRQVVLQVVGALIGRKSVFLEIPADLPWRHQMRGAVELELRKRAGAQELLVQTIDVRSECPDCSDVGRFLLARFGSEKVQRSYREGSGETIQSYILRNGILRNQIVWVKGLRPGGEEAWLSFCRGYTPPEFSAGLFVVEHSRRIPGSGSRRMAQVVYSQSVRSYDLQLFNSMLLDGKDGTYTRIWKSYIAAVAASLCETDAEISERLIMDTDFMHESPLAGLARIAQLPDFQRRGAEEGSGHVLHLVRAGQTAALEKRIWAAQVQIAFPIVELERVRIIRLWEDEIGRALALSPVTQYGREITHPIELELGTLSYMASHRGADGMYLLYLPDQEARDRLRFLHERRNELAHVACCSPENLTELFRGME